MMGAEEAERSGLVAQIFPAKDFAELDDAMHPKNSRAISPHCHDDQRSR